MPQSVKTVCLVALCWLSTCGVAIAGGDPHQAKEMDWPHWRGPEMNGVSREKGIVDKWSPKGENLLWKREDLGSRSTPIVMNGKLYTILRDKPETKFEGEKVICIDAKTGEDIWENRFNVFLSDVPDTRVGWSAVTGDTETGNVFALGVSDYLQCIDGETGKTIWSHSLSEEYGALSTYGGRTNNPIIQGNLCIISSIIIGWGDMAKPCHRFIAFDKRNGQPVWFEGTRLFPYDTTYSSPVATVIDGQKAIVFGSGDGGIHALQSATGKSLWKYNISRRGINTTPLVIGNTVVAGHSEENVDDTKMGALFAIDATKTDDITKSGEKWRIKEAFVGKSTPVHYEGRIYACEDTGTLQIVDLETGKKVVEKGVKLRGPVRSSPLFVDGKIFICTENTIWWTLKPTEDGVDVVHRARLSAGGSYGSPIVSHGRLYVPTTDALFCVGNADVEAKTDKRPDAPKIPSRSENPTAAHVQLVPVESLLRPGDEVTLAARIYNSKGQFLRMAENVEFSVDGPGKIDADGVYTTPDKAEAHSAIKVTAKVDGLVGNARVRLVPDLPWNFNFDDGVVPVTWVGARYRNICLDYDLYTKLKEADPRAADLYIWIHTSFTNANPKVATFDNSNPARPNWTKMLIFFGLDGAEEAPKDFEAAKAVFADSLKMLVDEKYIADFKWEELPDDVGPKLVVNRGDRKEIGNGVMCKIRTIPLGTKSQGWMGHPDIANYTIQTDIMGLERNGKVPDMGMIGQRYTMDMRGAMKQLEIRTWPPQRRMAQAIPLEWKPNVWYTMKMQAAVEGDKSVLRGKVWERDAEEPKEWMVVADDVSPNVIGSPGIFGNARDAEILYDNFKITPNATPATPAAAGAAAAKPADAKPADAKATDAKATDAKPADAAKEEVKTKAEDAKAGAANAVEKAKAKAVDAVKGAAKAAKSKLP
ncbi:PQQ-like beta-propeller repeat protein [bacterium]|nr:PQQ-like beta-propeller repeat protein [bacterium]